MVRNNVATITFAELALLSLASSVSTLSTTSALHDNLVSLNKEIDYLLSKEPFLNNDHNNIIMERDSTVNYCNTNNSNQRTNWTDKLLFLIQDESLEMGEQIKFDSFLNSLRKEKNYPLFLNYLLNLNNRDLLKAIALFLSQKDFIFINACEEKFIIDLLKIQDAEIQEYALNAVFLWERISDKETLKNIKIRNKYLQEDLDSFLGE